MWVLSQCFGCALYLCWHDPDPVNFFKYTLPWSQSWLTYFSQLLYVGLPHFFRISSTNLITITVKINVFQSIAGCRPPFSSTNLSLLLPSQFQYHLSSILAVFPYFLLILGCHCITFLSNDYSIILPRLARFHFNIAILCIMCLTFVCYLTRWFLLWSFILCVTNYWTFYFVSHLVSEP